MTTVQDILCDGIGNPDRVTIIHFWAREETISQVTSQPYEYMGYVIQTFHRDIGYTGPISCLGFNESFLKEVKEYCLQNKIKVAEHTRYR